MPVIERTTWRCPNCPWACSYDEPMTTVYCVACFREGRGQDVTCERVVPMAEVGRLRKALLLAGRTLNMVGRVDEAQVALDALNA